MITSRQDGTQHDQLAAYRDDLEVTFAGIAIDRNEGSPA